MTFSSFQYLKSASDADTLAYKDLLKGYISAPSVAIISWLIALLLETLLRKSAPKFRYIDIK